MTIDGESWYAARSECSHGWDGIQWFGRENVAIQRPGLWMAGRAVMRGQAAMVWGKAAQLRTEVPDCIADVPMHVLDSPLCVSHRAEQLG